MNENAHASRAVSDKPTASPKPFRAALVQLCTGRDLAENIAIVSEQVRAAAAGGAVYVQTPEVTALMETERSALFAHTPHEHDNVAEAAFAALAAELGIYLHIGSMGVRVGDDKIANRAFLFGPSGARIATYDKVHMFDVVLPGGEQYRESKNYTPGTRAVVVDLPFARIGITICYDLRFPSFYESLSQLGCDVITVPSAFTVPTGRAHWHTLLRARAIETQAFVLAAAQSGAHACGRKTFGHSLAVSPWGEVLAEGGVDAPEVIFADIDPAMLSQARERVPALTHRRAFDVTLISSASHGDEPQSAFDVHGGAARSAAAK